jgi:hypothetical protein
MKRRNPSFGYQRIAQQLSLVFNTEVDKDVVRRVLARHFRPDSSDRGSSWLTFLGHSKDSLWSLDFFRCESLTLILCKSSGGYHTIVGQQRASTFLPFAHTPESFE